MKVGEEEEEEEGGLLIPAHPSLSSSAAAVTIISLREIKSTPLLLGGFSSLLLLLVCDQIMINPIPPSFLLSSFTYSSAAAGPDPLLFLFLPLFLLVAESISF